MSLIPFTLVYDRLVIGDQQQVCGSKLAFGQNAFTFQNIDPELEVAFYRQAAFTHAVAGEELRDLGVFAAFFQ